MTSTELVRLHTHAAVASITNHEIGELSWEGTGS